MRYARPLLLAGSIIALVAALAAAKLTPAGAGPEGPTLTLLAPARDVHVGENFDIVVYAEHLANIGAYEIDVHFDDEQVAFLAFDDGDLLGSTGRSVSCLAGPATDSSTQWGCASSGSAAGASGDGILAVLTFTALEKGGTNIRLRDAALADTNGDPIAAETAGVRILIVDKQSATGGEAAGTRTAAAAPTRRTTSTATSGTPASTRTSEPSETETAEPGDTFTPETTQAPTEEAETTNTPVPTSTESAASETPAVSVTSVAKTPTQQAETETPEATETPVAGETATPATTPVATETVAAGTETPDTSPTPEEEKPTETATPNLIKTETPESTGTPGFVPPTSTPQSETATSTSVATATNTVVVKTHTPAAPTRTPAVSTAVSTASPGATSTAAASQTETNEVLGTTNDGPQGIVLPVTGSGGDDGPRGSASYAAIAFAAGIAAAIAATALRRRI